jgi:micrococcal nuclease
MGRTTAGAASGSRGTTGFVAAALPVLVLAAPAGALEACWPTTGFEAAVADIPEADTIRLADGRTVRLAGVAAPRPLDETPTAAPVAASNPIPEEDLNSGEPDVPGEIARGFRLGAGAGGSAPRASEAPTSATAVRLEAARRYLEGLTAGRSVAIRPVVASPDRHGRIVAQVIVTEGGAWLQHRLVAAGAARVVPVGREADCARPLLSAETEARRERRGFWAEAGLQPRRADDPDLAKAAGTYVLVEGTVVSTGKAGGRHYLNFGRDYRRDFTAVIDDKEAGRFSKAGFDAARLKGREVRVRGWLTARDGGLMTLSVPEEIEWTR